MKSGLALMLCIGFVIVMPCCDARSATDLVQSRQPGLLDFEAGFRTSSCLTQGDVLNSLRRLSSAKSQPEADEARQLLLNESNSSPACRNQVIAAIMEAMNKPNATFKGNPELFNLWRAGATLLGDLKANKALDLLISHLDLSSGIFSTTMSQQPALSALIKMGPIAIPKLSAVMRGNPNPDFRRYAVYCIAAIGGQPTRRALEHALPLESDPCVNRFIRVSIETLDSRTDRLKNDTGKWFSAFMCIG